MNILILVTEPKPLPDGWNTLLGIAIPWITIFGAAFTVIAFFFNYLDKRDARRTTEAFKAYLMPILDELDRKQDSRYKEINEQLKYIQKKLDKNG